MEGEEIIYMRRMEGGSVEDEDDAYIWQKRRIEKNQGKRKIKKHEGE